MSGSYYVLNAKYNSLLALISGGGGGGGVSNPMTSDLNAGGFDITNATDINAVDLNASADLTANRVIATNLVQGAEINATDSLIATKFNNTEAPSYANLGAIVPATQYEIATITPKADAEGSIIGVLRALDSGLKHQVFFQVIAYADRAVIRILNNVSESDTPIFVSLEYGEDSVDATKNSLTFTCGTPSATCELAFYQNQSDKGTGSYGSPFVGTAGAVIATHSTTYSTQTLYNQTSGTSANFRVESNLFADDTDTKTLQTNTLATYTNPEIQLVNDMNLVSSSSIKQAVSVQTNNLVSGGAFPIQITSDTDFQNNLLVNSVDDFLNIDENIDLQATGHGIVNLTALTGTNAGADAIAMNSDVNMSNNAISNVDNIKTDSIFENTVGNGITIHNQTNMTNNKIINLAAPTNNGDGATKLYVDTVAGSSGVQNPMVANLDGGNFNITNVNGMTATQLSSGAGGLMTSNGTFQHGGLSSGDFGVGGQTITFAPGTSFKIKNFGLSTTYFDYDQATKTLTTENGARQELAGGATMEVKSGAEIAVATGGKVDASPGGSIVFNSTAVAPTNFGELNMLDVRGLGITNLPQSFSLVDTAPTPQVFGCSTIINSRFDGTTIPFDTGTSWDNNNDGTLIYGVDSNSLVFQEGLPTGVNNHDNNQVVFNGWLVGIGANNASNLGGWVCSGGASIEVIGAVAGPFPVPCILGDSSSAFNQENRILPQAGWVRADETNRGGIALAIRLNIPVGDTINVLDPANLAVNLNKIIIQEIPVV